ncbi:MAG: class I SAM-dependent methyltransferase [Desulfurococcaceae archaeon TW002]
MKRVTIEFSNGSADVLEWYDELSSSYEELYGEEQSRKYTRVFKELLLRNHLTRENQVILDLGCGAGGLIRFLHNEFPSTASSYYVGLDLSPSMCFLSRKQINQAGLLGDVIAGDIFRPPFRDRAANTILSITVLTCRDSLREVILSLKNLLRSNGLLYYTVLCSESHKIPVDIFDLCEAITQLSQREILCVTKS